MTNKGLPLPPDGELLLIAGGREVPIRRSSFQHTTKAFMTADTTTLMSANNSREIHGTIPLYGLPEKRKRELCEKLCSITVSTGKKFRKLILPENVTEIPRPNIQTNPLLLN